MTATTLSTALAPVQPAFTDAVRLALAGYLAGYRGLTRAAYTLDLRPFTSWSRTRSLPLFSVRRADIETFARELEAKGRARATVTRRLCTIAPGSTGTPSRKSSSTTPRRRTSEGRGWTTSRVVTIPLAPRTARPIDLVIGERTEGRSSPPTGGGWTGTAPPGSYGGSPAVPRSPSTWAAHAAARVHHRRTGCRGARGTCRKPHRTPTRAPRCAMTGRGPAWTGTRPTSSPPTSPEQRGRCTITPWKAVWPPSAARLPRPRTAVLRESAPV